MSAVLNAQRDSEQAFFDSQQLPPEKRGVSFEALFFRQLQQVTTRIHETENVEQIMLEASQDICKLLNADRLTLYAVNEDRTAIVSKVKTGLNTSRDLKLPISAQSLAGYAAVSRQLLNIADVYDDEALKRVHPTLSFLKEVDKRSGYRTKQMLVRSHPRRRHPAWRAAGHQQQERPAVRRTRSRRRDPVVQDAGHRDPPAHAEGATTSSAAAPPSTTGWSPKA